MTEYLSRVTGRPILREEGAKGRPPEYASVQERRFAHMMQQIQVLADKLAPAMTEAKRQEWRGELFATANLLREK